MSLLELIKRYGDLREASPVESECGSPVRAAEIDAEAAAVLVEIEAGVRAFEAVHAKLYGPVGDVADRNAFLTEIAERFKVKIFDAAFEVVVLHNPKCGNPHDCRCTHGCDIP